MSKRHAETGDRTGSPDEASTFEGCPDAMLIAGADGRILAANARAAEILGYARAELAGLELRDLDERRARPEPSERLEGPRDAPLDAPPGGERASIERTLQKKDGAAIPCEISARRLEDGRRLFVLREVAARKQSESDLQRALSLLAATLESTADGILVVDPTGRMVRFNQRFVEMWGIPESVQASRDDSQALAFVLDQLVDPKGFLGKVQELYALPEAESFDSLEFKDGRILERYSRPQRVEGRSVGRVWSFRDVTERRRAEAALRSTEEHLRQAQKMEAIGRLAGGVAHDFNNILTVILGYVEVLASALPEDGPHRPNLEEIRQAAERAAALTHQLLAFSRRQVLEPRVIDLNDVVEGVVRILERLIGEDVRLTIRAAGDLGRVKADPSQIEQVLFNLALNARDAMPSGGELRIETLNAEIDAAWAQERVPLEAGSYAVLAVSDNGIGMDDETRQRIFEPFYTTKGRGKGTGLGLATVYGIVSQSGGYIWVYSEPGRGTTFKVYLPLVEHSAPVPAAGTPQVLAVPGGRETVLLVEDDAVVRSLVMAALAQNGYTVVEAPDGLSAIEASRRHQGPIRLMISDVVMPGMSGRTLADRLAAERPDMRILYISGYTDDAIVQHGVLEPGIALLQKPFTADALARKVREVLDCPPTPRTPR